MRALTVIFRRKHPNVAFRRRSPPARHIIRSRRRKRFRADWWKSRCRRTFLRLWTLPAGEAFVRQPWGGWGTCRRAGHRYGRSQRCHWRVRGHHRFGWFHERPVGQRTCRDGLLSPPASPRRARWPLERRPIAHGPEVLRRRRHSSLRTKRHLGAVGSQQSVDFMARHRRPSQRWRCFSNQPPQPNTTGGGEVPALDPLAWSARLRGGTCPGLPSPMGYRQLPLAIPKVLCRRRLRSRGRRAVRSASSLATAPRLTPTVVCWRATATATAPYWVTARLARV